MTRAGFLEAVGLAEAPPARLVWIVEDFPFVAEGLARLCRSLGHAVVAMVAIEGLKDGVARGPSVDGELVQVPLARVEVAFLDYQFDGSDGAELAGALSGCGQASIVAMSSDPTYNARILKAGGHKAIVKGEIRRMLESLNA